MAKNAIPSNINKTEAAQALSQVLGAISLMQAAAENDEEKRQANAVDALATRILEVVRSDDTGMNIQENDGATLAQVALSLAILKFSLGM